MIGKQLKKLFWSTRQRAVKTEQTWRSSVAEAFVPFYQKAPIMRVFLQKNITTSKRMEIDSWKAKLIEHNPDIDWTMFYTERYGLTAGDLQEVERFLAHLPQTPGYLVHHTLSKIIQIDDCEVFDRPLF